MHPRPKHALVGTVDDAEQQREQVTDQCITHYTTPRLFLRKSFSSTADIPLTGKKILRSELEVVAETSFTTLL